jgi:starch synthase
MKQLTYRYPKCFWSSPDNFFTDGPLANIGSDFALMPSLFEPGGIVQHEFFCGGTPVIAFRTGGLKDTIF